MLKKIFSLFIGISLLLITPVFADKEYKFTLDKDLENKQIIYEWENHIDNFSFQMISPSNQIYSLDSYELIDYDENANKVTISFEKLQAGQWKVLFKGDSNPTGLNNQIIDYYSVTPTPIVEEEIIDDESTEVISNDIIVIGAENTNTEVEENSSIEEENIEENIVEEISEEEKALLKEKEELALKREQERNEALVSKKEQKLEEEKIKEEQELEIQREESEISLEFEESDSEIIEESSESTESSEQVIILGTDENSSPTVVDIEKSESDVNIVNINADEERAKIESQLQAENNKILVNNAIMITPLIISVFLFLINLLTKNKSTNKK